MQCFHLEEEDERVSSYTCTNAIYNPPTTSKAHPTSYHRSLIDQSTKRIRRRMQHRFISYHITSSHINTPSQLLPHFFSPPNTFCTLPPTAPSGLKFLPIMPSLARGPPTFSPTLPMAPSLVKAPPMVPFASNAAGALLSVGFWPLGGMLV